MKRNILLSNGWHEFDLPEHFNLQESTATNDYRLTYNDGQHSLSVIISDETLYEAVVTPYIFEDIVRRMQLEVLAKKQANAPDPRAPAPPKIYELPAVAVVPPKTKKKAKALGKKTLKEILETPKDGDCLNWDF